MSFFTTFSTTFFIIFAAIMGLIFLIVILLRISKYGSVLGSLASTLQGGIPIIDQAGQGEIGELIGFEQHPETKKIRLRLNFLDKFTEGQTPFIFDEEDFYPPLSMINWNSYHGTIICYWDFERNRDYRDNQTAALTIQLRRLRNQLSIYKRMGIDLMQYFEKQKLTEGKEKSDLHFAQAFRTVKEIVSETNVDENSPGKDEEGMFD